MFTERRTERRSKHLKLTDTQKSSLRSQTRFCLIADWCWFSESLQSSSGTLVEAPSQSDSKTSCSFFLLPVAAATEIVKEMNLNSNVKKN